MTPQWISIGIAILVQTGTIAFILGGALRDIKALKEDAKKHDTTHDDVIGIAVNLNNMQKSIENIERNMQGVQRQLANLMTTNFKGGAAE